MSETFPTPPEEETKSEVTLDIVANDPREGDTIIYNPGAELEIKYVVTSVGQEGQNLPQYGKKGKYLGTEYTQLDVVKFTYTLRGQTMDYTRTREQFASQIKSLPSQVDIVKCFRKY